MEFKFSREAYMTKERRLTSIKYGEGRDERMGGAFESTEVVWPEQVL